VLTGKSDELRKYVGQRVEVRGKLDTSMGAGSMGSSSTGSTTGSSTGSTTGSTTGGTTGTGSSSMSDTSNMPKLQVQSVRAIGGSCPGGQQ
jgi:hypothetical protein